MKIVRVTNNGDKPFVGKFDGEKFTIQPQSETLIPYGAMVLWCGDPAARNVDERNRHRVKENARLHVKYGAYDDEVKFAENAPKLECYTLDGELIPTVLTDPEGDLGDLDLSDSTEENAVRRELVDLRGQMNRIEEMLANGTLQVVAPGAEPGPSIPVAEILPPAGEEPPAVPSTPPEQPEITEPLKVTQAKERAAKAKELKAQAEAEANDGSGTPPVDEPARVRVGARSAAK